MQHSLEAMKLAVRVLTAITEKGQPDPADVTELRRLAPLHADCPLDELACDVIQEAIRRRAEVRARTD